jgi:carboxyl-terminal processing protease
MDLNAAVALIRGEEGTTVTITLQRDEEVLDVEVTRRQIDVETVTYRMLEDNIGYIQVDEFDEVTANQFSTALDALTAQGMEALVVDIRNNPGGLLNVVVDMLDEILPEGIIVSVKDKNGVAQEYKSDAETRLNVPMAVLINGNSASASEILAGAIKDYEYGTLIGTTTFGKGIVQTIFPLEDGDAVKLTTAKYFTPNGNYIHGVGIDPDIELEYEYLNPDGTEYDVKYDNQIQKAVEVLTEELSGK